MTRIPKIVALLAVLAAAGCTDSYPAALPPEGIFYYPVGLAVRQVAPTPTTPLGSTQLVVVSSNFDLRYQEEDGGTLQVVDPDASQDITLGGALAVYDGGFQRIGTFGGEVAVIDAACQPGWPGCPSACPQLAADPAVAAGGSKVLLASRAIQTLYRMDMNAAGALTCGTGCTTVQSVELLDPYGVAKVCNSRGGTDRADAYFTYLRGANNAGWLSRMALSSGEVTVLTLGVPATYGAAYAASGDWLFVSGGLSTSLAPLRWINPSVQNQTYNGVDIPVFHSYSTTSVVLGSNPRAVAVSNDGLHLYLAVDLYDADLLRTTGSFYLEGGALAVFSIAPDANQQPEMQVEAVVPSCLGTGQLQVLPPRPGKGDLIALTCDREGALMIFDVDLGFAASYLGLDKDTGLPVLGRMPFGIATEPIDPGRAATTPVAPGYDPSPCVPGRSCNRLYVGSFFDHWVNVLELDPDRPESVTLVKRIGRGP